MYSKQQPREMATSYTLEKINLSPAQVTKLIKGDTVRLSNQIDGNVPVYLTSTQVKKLATARSKGVGCELRLSTKQIQYMRKHGTGFMDFLGGILDVVKPAAGTFLNALAPVAAGVVAKKLGGSQQSGSMSWVPTDEFQKARRLVTSGNGLYMPGTR